jgi:hypothetical protein
MRHPLRLHHYRFGPIQAEPVQVFIDRVGKFGSTARRVDVFETQQEGAAETLRPEIGKQRRVRVAQMQMAIGARREAQDRRRHGPL